MVQNLSYIIFRDKDSYMKAIWKYMDALIFSVKHLNFQHVQTEKNSCTHVN